MAAVACLCVSLLVLPGCGTRLPADSFARRPAGGGATATAGGRDGATDVGVTAAGLRIGVLASLTSPVGSEAFSGPAYGAQAFFRALDDRGGLHGRKVSVSVCDDGGSGIGNQDCVHRLIDQDKVFALSATTVLDYTGAPYVSQQAVPDVGGQPVTTAYDRWPHLYAIGGNSAPRDGRAVGWDGILYQSTEVFRYFRQRLSADRAAVIAYNQADSLRYAAQLADGLRAEGFHVLTQTVDLALPDFQSVAVAMKADGTQVLFDAMDARGNAGLCGAMEAAGTRVAAKVTNVENWTASAGEQYRSAPGCRAVLWATSSSRNYEDVRFPAVQEFRDAMARYFPDRAGQLSAWELEGWAAAQWLTDAIDSCGDAPTRACVERFMNRTQPYDAHSLLLPASFTPSPPPSGTTRACLNVARWSDAADSGRGGWVTQVADMTTNCFDVPSIPYRP